MKQKLFIDTNVLCAIDNPEDSQHHKAEKARKIISNYIPVISNFILLETYTILSQRVSKNFVIDFGEGIFRDRVFTVIWINKKLENDVWEIFKAIKNKNFSYVDASILAVMKKEKIKHLLSFDTSFKPLQKEYGFQLIGR